MTRKVRIIQNLAQSRRIGIDENSNKSLGVKIPDYYCFGKYMWNCGQYPIFRYINSNNIKMAQGWITYLFQIYKDSTDNSYKMTYFSDQKLIDTFFGPHIEKICKNWAKKVIIIFIQNFLLFMVE